MSVGPQCRQESGKHCSLTIEGILPANQPKIAINKGRPVIHNVGNGLQVLVLPLCHLVCAVYLFSNISML